MARKGSPKNGVSALRTVINTLSYLIMIFGIALLISATVITVANDAFAFTKSGEEIQISYSEKQTLGQVANTLKENGIIKYKWAFKLFASLKKADTFPGGTYKVSASMDYSQLISLLSGGGAKKKAEVEVTIPEGYTMAQIAELMQEKGVCSSAEFLKTADTYEFSHWMLKDVPMVPNRLEGYLFPDTYRFYVNDKPVNVINKMLNNFVNRFTGSMKEIVDKGSYSVAEIIVIASMIEKEAKHSTERSVIGGVIYNRLKSADFPYLQIDATLLYVLGHKEALTAEDLQLESPYNTYVTAGLPPTAICNPGLSSILAAIVPDKNSYYYYVANPDTGYHIFSHTAAEHQKAVEYVRSLIKKD